ncbi:MAG: fumarate hydratase C-terminal domain-containing protein [Desulfobacterales bacterium]
MPNSRSVWTRKTIQYIKDHIIYYAGPAKNPKGYASGSSGLLQQPGWILYKPLFPERAVP